MARILLVGNFYASYLNEELFDDKIIIADGNIKELVDAAANYLRHHETTSGRFHTATYVFMVMGITDLVKKQLVSGRYLLEPQSHPLAVIEYEMRRAVDVYQNYDAFPIWTTTYPISLSKYHKSQGWSHRDLSRFNISPGCTKEQEVLFNTFDKVMNLCRALNKSVDATDIFFIDKVYCSVGEGRHFQEEYLVDDGINPVEEVIDLWNQQLRPYMRSLRDMMPNSRSSSTHEGKRAFKRWSTNENYDRPQSHQGFGQENPMKRLKVENALMDNLGKQSSEVQKELAMGMLKFISEKLGDDVFFSSNSLVSSQGSQSNIPTTKGYQSRDSGRQASSLLHDPPTSASLETSDISNYKDAENSYNPAAIFNSSLLTIPHINNLVDMTPTTSSACQSHTMASSKGHTDSFDQHNTSTPMSQENSQQYEFPHVPLLPQTPGNHFAQAYNRYAMMPDPMKLFERDGACEWRKKKISALKYLYKNKMEKRSLLKFQHKFYAEKLQPKDVPVSDVNDSVAPSQLKVKPLLPNPVLSMETQQNNGSQQVVKPLLELEMRQPDLPYLQPPSESLCYQYRASEIEYWPAPRVKAIFKEKTGMRKVTYHTMHSPINSVHIPTPLTPERLVYQGRPQKHRNYKVKVYPAVEVLTSLAYPMIAQRDAKYAQSGLKKAAKESYLLMAKPGPEGAKSHLRVKGIGRCPGRKSKSHELAFYYGNHPPAVGFLEVEAVVPGRENRDCVMTPLQCDVASFNLQLYHLMNRRAKLEARLKESTDPSICVKISQAETVESNEAQDERADSNEISPSVSDMFVLSEVSNNQKDSVDAEEKSNMTESRSAVVVGRDEIDQISDTKQAEEQVPDIAESEHCNSHVLTHEECEGSNTKDVAVEHDAQVGDANGQVSGEASNL